MTAITSNHRERCQEMGKCQDSGQMVLYPIRFACEIRTAWCGCCGRNVFVVSDANEI